MRLNNGDRKGPRTFSLTDAARAARGLRTWAAALRRAQLTLAADFRGEGGPEGWLEESLRALAGGGADGARPAAAGAGGQGRGHLCAGAAEGRAGPRGG